MRVSMPMAQAAAGVLLVGIAAVLPGWYRESWMWENPVQATIGASLAITASAGSVAVAVAARQQRIMHRTAVLAGSALLPVVILGCLLFIRSGAHVIPVYISPGL